MHKNTQKSPEIILEQTEIPIELIASRAYDKWQQRGCPLWEEQTDWFAARTELEQQASHPQEMLENALNSYVKAADGSE